MRHSCLTHYCNLRKQQVVSRHRSHPPPPLTSNTQQWHLLYSPLAQAPASSASVIQTVCAGCSRAVDRWCWRRRTLLSPLQAGPGWGSTRRTEPKIHRSEGGSVSVLVLSSGPFLSLVTSRCETVLAPFSQLVAPQHTAILFSFSTTTSVDSSRCWRQGGGGGLRGGVSNHVTSNSSFPPLHSWKTSSYISMIFCGVCQK